MATKTEKKSKTFHGRKLTDAAVTRASVQRFDVFSEFAENLIFPKSPKMKTSVSVPTEASDILSTIRMLSSNDSTAGTHSISYGNLVNNKYKNNIIRK
jgi:hypothetical protein